MRRRQPEDFIISLPPPPLTHLHSCMHIRWASMRARGAMGWCGVVSAAVLLVNSGLTHGTNVQRLSRAHFEFTLDLYRNLMEAPGGRENVLFSPYSIYNVLSMLFLGAGATSDTSRQLREALHYTNLSYAEVHNAFKLVLENFQDSYYNETVQSANGVFRQSGVGVSSYYERALEEFYKTRMDALDFAGDEAGARDFINRWVDSHTAHRIPQLLNKPLAAETQLVLVNALAMKARWLFSFDEAHTFAKGLFYINSQRRFEIPMMIGKFKLPLGYSQDLECRVLEIPFKERRISLFILLPDDLDRGLARLEEHMSSDTIKALFSTLKDEMVNIRLPRFRVSQSANLVEALVRMGVTDIFSASKADFSGMSDERSVYISDIAHKTVLEVRESGADGAAATATGLERIGSFGDKYFEVDHPFLFFIWDYRSGIVLFMGRVADPTPITD